MAARGEARSLKCYLIAAPREGVDGLVAILNARHVSIRRVFDAGTAGGLAEELLDQLSESDFVVAVMPREQSPNVYYELGIAFGLSKRVLIFSSPESSVIPFDGEAHLVVRASLDNTDAVTFAVDQIIRAPNKVSASRAGFSAESKPLGVERAKEYRDELRAIPPNQPQAFEEFVYRLLKACGFDALSRGQESLRADFAVWSDDFDSGLGNPLLIEVRTRLQTAADIRKTGESLQSQLVQAKASWGLIIYRSGLSSTIEILNSLEPQILAIRVDRLLERLQKRSFAEIVGGMRNHRVHNVEP